MIIVNKPVLEACQSYTESPAAGLSPATTADVLLEVCQAAIEARGAQTRAWWVDRLKLNGIVRHLIETKILIVEGNDVTYMPEGTEAQLIAGGANLDWFDELWKEYKPGPGLQGKAKGARAAAVKAWGKIKRMDRKLFDRIMLAVKSEVASSWSGSNGHNPHMATWLNQKRWEDVEASPEAPGSTETADQATVRRTDALLQKMRGMMPGGA